MPEEKLEPCPFCGGPAWEEKLITTDQDYVRFGCRGDECDIRPNSGWHEVSEEIEAQTVWNKRSVPSLATIKKLHSASQNVRYCILISADTPIDSHMKACCKIISKTGQFEEFEDVLSVVENFPLEEII